MKTHGMGSWQNVMAANAAPLEPAVGLGATERALPLRGRCAIESPAPKTDRDKIIEQAARILIDCARRKVNKSAAATSPLRPRLD